LIAEPRLFGHAPATPCFDADAQLNIENTNRSVKVRLHLRAKLNERVSISLLIPTLSIWIGIKSPATSLFVIKNPRSFITNGVLSASAYSPPAWSYGMELWSTALHYFSFLYQDLHLKSITSMEFFNLSLSERHFRQVRSNRMNQKRDQVVDA
jgi:hypothetical protein